MTNLLKLLAGIVGLSLISTAPLSANSVTVKESGMGANQTVWINSSTLGTQNVYAGVIKLEVDGVMHNGFCIDPFQWSSSSSLSYDLTRLDLAPKVNSGMGMAAADKIEQLWAHYYSPSITNANAAGLQIAIWELVAGGVGSPYSFSIIGNDYGAAGMISWVGANSGAPKANLIGLSNRSNQDYTIQVPDVASTLGLFGLALVGFAALRRKLHR